VNLARKAFAGASWVSLSSLTSNGLQLLQLALLARLLPPQDFGIIALATVVVGFAQTYTDMGMGQVVIHRQDATQRQLSSLYWLNVLVGAAIFCVVQILAPLLAEFWQAPELTGVMRWCAAIFLVEPLGQQFRLRLEKELLFGALAAIEIAASIVAISVALYAALHGAGVYALAWGPLAGAAIKAACLVALGWSRSPPSLCLQIGELKGFLRFGFYQMAERSINFVGFNLDKLLLGSLLGMQALGYYTVAYQLMSRPYQVFNPILTRVAFPVFARMQDDDARLRRGFLRMIGVVALIMFPVYALMIALAEPLLGVMLGSGWQPAVGIFRILALLGFFYSVGNPLGSLLLAKGRTDIGFYLNLFMIGLYVPAIWLGARYGGEGVAWCLIAATAFGLFPVGFLVRYRLVGLRPLEYLAAISPMLASAAAVGWLAHLVDASLSTHANLFRLVFLAAAGGLAYLALIYRWKKHEWKELWTALR
jgi:O-antigen/teichoic acid export membrane protein